MITEQKLQLIKLLYPSLEYFSKHITPHLLKDAIPKFHKNIYSALSNEEITKLCMIIFRGGSKSTIGITINLLWRIAYDREKYVWIVAEGIRQAVERLHDVKYELETNEVFRDLYGSFVTDKWSETEIVTENPRTGHRTKFVALGSKQRMRGGLFEGSRVTRAILDDFESETNTETEELRDKLRRWLYATVYPAVDPKYGAIQLQGTVCHYDAYLNYIKDNPGDWKVLEYPVEYGDSTDGNRPRWPERFSSKWIKSKRNEFANDGRLSYFLQEYYNIPVSEEDKPFKESGLKYWNGWFDKKEGCLKIHRGDDIVSKPVNITVGVDPSMGKKKGDFSAMTAIGTSRKNVRYTIRSLNKRIQPSELIEEMFKWNDEFTSPWGKPLFVIETVAMQELLMSWLKSEQVKRNKFLRTKEVKHRQGKDGENSRFLMIQPIYEAGLCRFKKDHSDVVSQLLRWGPNIRLHNDDALDSYQMAMVEAKPCGRVETDYDKYQKDRKPKEYNWMTL